MAAEIGGHVYTVLAFGSLVAIAAWLTEIAVTIASGPLNPLMYAATIGASR